VSSLIDAAASPVVARSASKKRVQLLPGSPEVFVHDVSASYSGSSPLPGSTIETSIDASLLESFDGLGSIGDADGAAELASRLRSSIGASLHHLRRLRELARSEGHASSLSASARASLSAVKRNEMRIAAAARGIAY